MSESNVKHCEHDFTKEEITAAVAKLTKAGVALARGVETVLVMAVYDSIVNESADVANALIGALRVSTKKAGIVAFLQQFGQLYDKGGKTGFVHFNLGKQAHLCWTKEYVETVKDAAMSWEAMKPVTPETAFDVIKAVEAIVKKAAKEGQQVTDGDLVPYLSALLAQYTSKKAIEAAQASAATAALPMGQVQPEGATV